MLRYLLTPWQELEARDRERNELLDELQALKRRTTDVDRLQQENESLKDEIRRLREGRADERPSLEKRTILGELSPNKAANKQHASSYNVQSSNEALDATAKYTKLFTEAKMLKAKHEDALEKLRDCRSVLRKRTDALNRWANIADLRQQTIQKLKARLKSLPASADGVSTVQVDRSGNTVSADEEVLVSVVPKKPSSLSSCEDGPSLSPTPLVKNNVITSTSPKRVLSEPPPQTEADGIFGDIPDDMTFDDETASADDVDSSPHLDHLAEQSLVTAKAEQSPDTPVFVSARPVRKRKHEKEDPEGGRLQSIKSEHGSSSDLEVIAESSRFSPANSIDFEEEVHIPTPRKRRALSRGTPGSLDNDPDGLPQRGTAGTTRPETPISLSGPDKPRTPSHIGVGLTSPSYQATALRQGTFLHMSWSVSAVKTGKLASTASHTSPLTQGVMDLAEDGEASSDSVYRPVVKGRLDALLNNSPPVNVPSPIDRAASRKVKTSRPVSFHDGEHSDDARLLSSSRRWPPAETSKSRESTTTAMLGHGSGIALSSLPTVVRDRGSKRPSILRDDMPRGRLATREEVPIRDRPIERLRPEDFKPNPKYNDGLTYVYDEVVRGKEARAALSGCTDLKCCGKTFRQFAEAEKKTVGSSVATRAEDISLMERYLGDQAWKLGSMSREEKDETWLLAKTWELANKFGKHRQRYSRMPTPPGFWNVDFPSTQERAEERRQAEKIRSALVLERYREAMRCGGTWLFRDEEPR